MAANKKKLGVIAMKVFGQENLIGKEPGKTDPDSLLRFALSLPVTTAVSGMPQVEMLEHNVALGRTFTPFSAADMERLRQELCRLAPHDGKEARWARRRPHRIVFGRSRPGVNISTDFSPAGDRIIGSSGH